MSVSSGLGYGDITGTEIVYDYATMTRATFNYTGEAGGLFASIGVAAYAGAIAGFRYVPRRYATNDGAFPSRLSELFIGDYKGNFNGYYVGGGIAGILGVGVGKFNSPDGNIRGSFSYSSLGKGFTPLGIEVVGFHTFYTVASSVDYYYDTTTHLVNKGKLISDILNGSHTPIPLGNFYNFTPGMIVLARISQISIALTAANNFEKYYQPLYGPFLFCPPKQPRPAGPPQPLPQIDSQIPLP